MKAIYVFLIFVAACSSVTFTQSPNEEEMLIRASALTKVAAAAESAARYKEPPADLSEQEFLTFATNHDASLLEPIRGYQLRALRVGRRAVVMVCSADGAIRLLEDAGCTAALDRHHWRGQDSPCEFSINVDEVCQ